MTAELEQEYRAARFREYASLSRNVAIAGAVMVLVLWLRDYFQNPAGAQATVMPRVLVAAGALLYAASLVLRVRRSLVMACGYASVVVVEFTVLEIWAQRLGADYAASFPGFLYIYLILPLVMLPFSLKENVISLFLVPLVPNAQALLGMAPGFPVLAFNALIWPACALALFGHLQYDRLLRRLYLTQRELREQAAQDPLTGLGNRRYLVHRGEQACALARRYGRQLCVLVLDLDHFKPVNDRYGHAAGDDVLRFVAASLGLQLRSTDICARTGGEEFAIVLPETNLAEAMQTAERIRETIAVTPVPSDLAPAPIRITASIGVAEFLQTGESLEEVLSQADGALYQAKGDGRNCVRAAAEPPRAVHRSGGRAVPAQARGER
jgi:diguanylate cyclase (GGDEF)-like protein